MGLEKLYELRQSFSIIGITGRTGSGCTKFAQILSSDFKEVSKKYSLIREPSEINVTNKASNRNFIQKYKVAHNYCKINWKRYKTIKYKDILYLIILIEAAKDINSFHQTLINYYKDDTLNSEQQEQEKKTFIKLFEELEEIVVKVAKSNKELFPSIHNLVFKGDKSSSNHLRKFYNKAEYKIFLESFHSKLSENYYHRTHYLHAIAYNLRTYGCINNADKKSENKIYTIISFINEVIKIERKNNSYENLPCHIVIDSLRNSMEIMFLKERYSAFNMVAVKGELRKKRLKNRLQDTTLVDKLISLDETEYKCNHFKEGILGAPDVQNCITQSDIHVFNSDESTNLCAQNRATSLETYSNNYFNQKNELNLDMFFSIGEQAMKLQALIQQPGIITPSSTERCMQIAYGAKLNSGCISRQVGAVVTDKNFSIKSVGWNDVPAGSTPCNLRDIREIEDNPNNIFTDFELGKGLEEYENSKEEELDDEDHLKQKDSNDFHTYLIEQYKDADEKVKKSGKPCSFCFKSAYNKYSGEDNQVHTRSLHAEENAMLQISKYSGAALEGGNLFTTASPCELCSKKAYQLGIKTIYYIDPYPGISMSHVLKNNQEFDPILKFFQGALGRAYHRLYEPFMAYKDEFAIETEIKLKEPLKVQRKKLRDLVKKTSLDNKNRKEVEIAINKLDETDINRLMEELIQKLNNTKP